MKTKELIERLEDQLYNFYSSKRDTTLPLLNSLTQDAIKESIRYRFEHCYDSIYRELVKYLTEVLGVPDVPTSEKPVFRLANENYLLPVSDWFRHSALRHETFLSSQLDLIPDLPKFIYDAKQLCEKMHKGEK